ncbi:MAG: HAMP domain-containing protein [Planctomycetes bacterium]|nr:HAMP domain-containing protein [Planctomycetota bacterium]
MFHNRFFKKLFFSYLVLITLGLGTLSVVSIRDFNKTYLDEVREQLRNTAYLVGTNLTATDVGRVNLKIKELSTSIDARITLIFSDGSVLADSEADINRMENHNSRPEVVAARAEGTGYAIRYSNTLGVEMMYCAMPLDGREGGIVRVAIPLERIKAVTHRIYFAVGIAFLVLTGLAAGMGYWLVSRIVRPIGAMVNAAEAISAGDFDKKVEDIPADEMGILARAINSMSGELRKKFAEIGHEKDTLNTVLSGIREGVIAVDGRDKILFANHEAGVLLDFDTTKASDTYIWEAVRNDRLIRFVKEYRANPSTVPAFSDINAPGLRQLRVYCASIAGPQEPSGSMVIVVSDITDAMKYEQLRRDFVANVSHELRTPLTFIKGYVETLQDLPPEERDKAKEFLAIIEKNVKQLTNLVEDLLDLARLESREGIARMRPADIGEVVRRVLDNFKPAVMGKGHNVIVDISEGLPLMQADSDLLEKAIGNLIDNAVKYTPAGGRIEVCVKPSDKAVRIEVRDNGIGIPQADMERIFERFYRVDKSRSREMGGTGLGLAIVKHIVQLHHGEVTVQSTPGKGSVFTISMPV